MKLPLVIAKTSLTNSVFRTIYTKAMSKCSQFAGTAFGHILNKQRLFTLTTIIGRNTSKEITLNVSIDILFLALFFKSRTLED